MSVSIEDPSTSSVTVNTNDTNDQVGFRVQYLLIEGNVGPNNSAAEQQNQPIDTETSQQYYYHSAHLQLKNSIMMETDKPYKRKTSAQTGAVNAPSVIVGFLAGIQVGTMLYNDIHHESWTVGVEEQSIRLAIIIFYISVVVGLIWGQGMMAKKFSFETLYTLMMFSSLTSVALFSSQKGTIILAYINKIGVGVAFGLGYISMLVHASEISDHYYRGRLLTLQHIYFFAGVFMSVLVPFTSDTKSMFNNPEFCLGILHTVCIFWSIYGLFFVMASPVARIRKDPQLCHVFNKATETFLKSRKFEDTDILPREVVEEFIELRMLVAEDSSTSSNIFKDNNICVMFIILLQRLGFFLTFNYALNQIFIGILETSSFSNDFKLLFIGARCISLCIVQYIIDKNRKLHAYLPMGISGFILMVIAFVILSVDASNISVILIIFFQFVCGCGVGVSSDVYTSEAFDTKKKPMSIFLLVVIDCLLHSLTVLLTFNVKLSSAVQIMITGGSGLGLVAIAFYMLIFLPDTSRLTLRAAKNKFKK
ncbi:unnamed protein product [Diamesa hyperborea]